MKLLRSIITWLSLKRRPISLHPQLALQPCPVLTPGMIYRLLRAQK